jgi:hypothetical protein
MADSWQQHYQQQQAAQQQQQLQPAASELLYHCAPDSLLLAVEGGVLQRGSGELYCFAWAAAQLAGGGAQHAGTSAQIGTGHAVCSTVCNIPLLAIIAFAAILAVLTACMQMGTGTACIGWQKVQVSGAPVTQKKNTGRTHHPPAVNVIRWQSLVTAQTTTK